jgi:dTDP-4-amino-4,6-dideoxygalactose transaminase
MAIQVTRSLAPSLEDFAELLRPAFEERRFTNDGPLLRRLEGALGARLGLPHVAAVANGTLALQLACAALGVRGEVITTPLSFVATASALAWMGLQPVFADVDPLRLTLDPARIEERVTPRTGAILATHVYGLPCDVDGIAAVAARHGLRVIYDASHAFGCRWRGRPLAAWGDAATLSFHATKIFHTAEGGLVTSPDAEVVRRCRVQRDFGFDGWDSLRVPGINAKLSELHAALGLCVLPLVDAAIAARRARFDAYLEELAPLAGRLRLPALPAELEYNYAYFPVLFPDEEALRAAWARLAAMQVFARRYFHPALSTLPWAAGGSAPLAEAICPRLLCLPLHDGLELADVARICAALRELSGA